MSFIISLIKYFFVLSLFLLCSCILGFFCYFTLYQDTDYLALLQQPALIEPNLLIALGVLILLPIILVFLIAPLFQISARPGRFASFLRLLLVIAMIGFLAYQLVDGRNVYQPYNQRDLIVRHPDASKAIFLLGPLRSASLGPIPSVAHLEDITSFQDLAARQNTIATAWQQIAPYRVVIDQLAELTILPQPVDSIGTKADPEAVQAVRAIGRLYLFQALLQNGTGDTTAALETLAKINRVANHGLAGSIRMTDKLIWAEMLEQNIRALYQIASAPRFAYGNLHQLATAVVPLTPEAVSPRSVWIGEYLSGIEELSIPPDGMVAHRFPPGTRRPLLLQIVPEELLTLSLQLSLQQNRTADRMRSFWEPVIDDAKTDLSAFRTRWNATEATRRNPPLRNLSGWYFFPIPDYTNAEKRLADLHRISQLLAAYVQSRLDFVDDINVYLDKSDNRRVIVDNRRIIDSGADQPAGSPDDITLEPLF